VPQEKQDRRVSERLVTPDQLVKAAKQVRLAIAARQEREGKQDQQAVQETLDRLVATASRDPQVLQAIKELQDQLATLGKQVTLATQAHLALLAELVPPE
jgi:hypothetical protein